MLTPAESTWGTSPSVIRIRSSNGPRQASRGLLILGQHQGHFWNLRSTTKRVFPKKWNLRAWAPILPHQQQKRRLPDTGVLLAGWCPRPPIRLRLWIEMRREKSPPFRIWLVTLGGKAPVVDRALRQDSVHPRHGGVRHDALLAWSSEALPTKATERCVRSKTTEMNIE